MLVSDPIPIRRRHRVLNCHLFHRNSHDQKRSMAGASSRSSLLGCAEFGLCVSILAFSDFEWVSAGHVDVSRAFRPAALKRHFVSADSQSDVGSEWVSGSHWTVHFWSKFVFRSKSMPNWPKPDVSTPRPARDLRAPFNSGSDRHDTLCRSGGVVEHRTLLLNLLG